MASKNAVHTSNRLEIAQLDSWYHFGFQEAGKDSSPVRAKRYRSACRGRKDITTAKLVNDVKDEARTDPKSGGG